ncbi:MAG: hypothetical protein IAG10_08525 [Planctomycetaceae bacterium]|nr:hypothetical protein [Planctomycetaceae bacterium]
MMTSGSGYESNPPSVFSDATLGLKPSGGFTQRFDGPAVAQSEDRVLPAGLPESGEIGAVVPLDRMSAVVIADPVLRVLVEAWPTLPEHVRTTIRMLVESVRIT